MAENILKHIQNLGMTVGTRIIGAALILVIGLKLSKYLVKLLSRLFKNIDPTAQSFLKSFFGILLKVLIAVSAAGVLGVPMTSVVTIVGSCGVAVGLAMQGGLSNLAGGLILLIIKPIRIGDYIVENEYEGTVSEIGIFYTTLVTYDNRRVLIPNGTLMNSTITAINQLEKRRVDLTFSASYSTDVDFAKAVIKKTAQEHPLVLKEPECVVQLSGHKDSAMEFTLRVWTKADDYWTVHFDLIENVKKAFDENNIEIPFPQMDVHVSGGKA